MHILLLFKKETRIIYPLSHRKQEFISDTYYLSYPTYLPIADPVIFIKFLKNDNKYFITIFPSFQVSLFCTIRLKFSINFNGSYNVQDKYLSYREASNIYNQTVILSEWRVLYLRYLYLVEQIPLQISIRQKHSSLIDSKYIQYTNQFYF